MVERRHCHIVELGLAMLHHASLPLKFWDHAFLTATYLINWLPSSSIDHHSPYKLIHHKEPDYQFLKVFGCSYFPLLRPYNQHKIQPWSEECLFLGNSPTHKGYKCLSKFGRIYISKDVVFNFPTRAFFSPNPFPLSLPPLSLPFHLLSVLPISPPLTHLGLFDNLILIMHFSMACLKRTFTCPSPLALLILPINILFASCTNLFMA
uniref:Retrovirus-related Pol polyprotein from transposon TNT 1-94 n=1 Tax=Cajanus cajan TaxID=3821 RepID=A0A151RIY8_CAJCA|nr:Retrovirus-related Pol polyprotein from transposon TNT 1-94 [Cajanus cajan]